MSTDGQHLLLHAYLDGELDSASAIATSAEIERDPKLAAELAGASALQKTLRARFPLERVPSAIARRIDAAIDAQNRVLGRSSVRWARPSWGALAACLLLAISLSSSATWVTTWLALRASAEDHLLGAIVDNHVRALLTAKPTDVSTSERHVIKPWFNGRIPQAPQVVDLTAKGFPLLGARIDVLDAAPIPTLVYTRRLHTISLLALPATIRFERAAVRSRNGQNLVSWSTGTTRYVAISDLNAEELRQFAQLFGAGASD